MNQNELNRSYAKFKFNFPKGSIYNAVYDALKVATGKKYRKLQGKPKKYWNTQFHPTFSLFVCYVIVECMGW